MSYCAHPSEIPRVLQDTPAPTNRAGLNHTKVFFWGGRSCHVLGVAGAELQHPPAGARWAEQGAQGCRGVLGVQRGTRWGSAESEGHSRVWWCLVGFTKAQWGQKEGGEAQQWGAVGNRICSPSQELLHCSGDGRKERRSGWGLLGLLQPLPSPSLPLPLCVSRAQDAESDAKGSDMISTSNSILPSASSALEPHGNSPEVLILCSSSRLSRAQGSRLSPRAPEQDGDREFGMGLALG